MESLVAYVTESSRGNFGHHLPCFGGYHLEKDGMPLDDAVGINCENGATTGNQGAGVKYLI